MTCPDCQKRDATIHRLVALLREADATIRLLEDFLIRQELDAEIDRWFASANLPMARKDKMMGYSAEQRRRLLRELAEEIWRPRPPWSAR